MKKATLIAIAISAGSIAFAQAAFIRTYGYNSTGGYSCTAQQTSDGGYILAGTRTVTVSDERILLVKTDPNGDTTWTKQVRSSIAVAASCVEQTMDGGYIISGYAVSPVTGKDALLVKTDASGTITWTKCYGGAGDDEIRAGHELSGGGYIFAGYSNSFGFGAKDIYLVRTDANGDTLWTRCIGGANEEDAYSVRPTADGGFILAGQTNSYGNGGGYFDEYLVKTDATGSVSWSKTFGGALNDTAFCVIERAGGGFAVTGTIAQNSSSYSIHLFTTDNVGAVQWTRSQAASWYGAGHSIAQTSDGGYVVGGYWGSGVVFYEVLKTDAAGSLQWNKVLTSELLSLVTPASVQQTSDGGFVFGHNASGALAMIRLDPGVFGDCTADTVCALVLPSVTESFPASQHKRVNTLSSTVTLLVNAGMNSTVYCMGTGMPEQGEMQFDVYPNPAASQLTVQFDEPVKDEAVLQLFDMRGQLISSQRLTENKMKAVMSIETLADGVYILQITTGETVTGRKVVVQH